MALSNEIAGAVEQDKWLVERMKGAAVPSHPRHQMLGGLFFQVQENATAIRVLLSFKHPLYGSAAALVRPILEMFVRGLWVRECATEEQFERVSNPKNDDASWPLRIAEMTAAVDSKGGFNGWLIGIQQQYWAAFCSYAHGGLRLIARRNSSEAIESIATEEEMIEIIRFALLMSLLAASIWCEIAGDVDGAKEAAGRAKSYL